MGATMGADSRVVQNRQTSLWTPSIRPIHISRRLSLSAGLHDCLCFGSLGLVSGELASRALDWGHAARDALEIFLPLVALSRLFLELECLRPLALNYGISLQASWCKI